ALESDIGVISDNIHNKIITNTDLCEIPEDMSELLGYFHGILTSDVNDGWQEVDCEEDDEETCDSVCLEQNSTGNRLNCENSVNGNNVRRECELSLNDGQNVHCSDNHIFSAYNDQHFVSCSITDIEYEDFISLGENSISVTRGEQWIDCDYEQEVFVDLFNEMFLTYSACEIPDVKIVCENGVEPNLLYSDFDTGPLSNECFSEEVNTQVETFDSTRYMPVVIHRYVDPLSECMCRMTNTCSDQYFYGSNLSSPEVTAIFTELNEAFSDINIKFVPTEIHVYVEEVSSDTFVACEIPETYDSYALNLYVTTSKLNRGEANTFGTHLKGNIFSVSSFVPDVVVHEVGHVFDLDEMDTNCLPGSSPCSPLVDEENCDEPEYGKRDGICDTPPHPGLLAELNPEGCENIEGTCDFVCGTDSAGDPYEVLLNYMYTQDPIPGACDHLKTFTPGQKAVMNCTAHTKEQLVHLLTDQRPETVLIDYDLAEMCGNLE
ncbi:hypothetical protein ACFL21_04935, partial [Patescibacteria group bacterium]